MTTIADLEVGNTFKLDENSDILMVTDSPDCKVLNLRTNKLINISPTWWSVVPYPVIFGDKTVPLDTLPVRSKFTLDNQLWVIVDAIPLPSGDITCVSLEGLQRGQVINFPGNMEVKVQ